MFYSNIIERIKESNKNNDENKEITSEKNYKNINDVLTGC